MMAFDYEYAPLNEAISIFCMESEENLSEPRRSNDPNAMLYWDRKEQDEFNNNGGNRIIYKYYNPRFIKMVNNRFKERGQNELFGGIGQGDQKGYEFHKDLVVYKSGLVYITREPSSPHYYNIELIQPPFYKMYFHQKNPAKAYKEMEDNLKKGIDHMLKLASKK